MKKKNELKEIDIKNRTCYYFNGKININDIDFHDICWTKNHMKIFKFLTLHIKLLITPYYVLLTPYYVMFTYYFGYSRWRYEKI